MMNISKWAIGIAIAATPLYSSALTVVIDNQTYNNVSPDNITFTEDGLVISTSGSGSDGGDSGSGDSGGGGGDSGDSGGDSGGGDSGTGGGSGGGSDELPDGAVFKKSYDLANPPGSQQVMTIESRTHVFPVTADVPNGKTGYGKILNAYSALNPAGRRMWFSSTPAGEPLDGGSADCDTRGSEGFNIGWIAGVSYGGYCQLKPNTQYYLNVEKTTASGESSRYIMNLKATIY